jgi:hypothetical protein
MAMGLIAMDPDKDRKAVYFEGLNWRLRNTSPETIKLLQKVAVTM